MEGPGWPGFTSTKHYTNPFRPQHPLLTSVLQEKNISQAGHAAINAGAEGGDAAAALVKKKDAEAEGSNYLLVTYAERQSQTSPVYESTSAKKFFLWENVSHVQSRGDSIKTQTPARYCKWLIHWFSTHLLSYCRWTLQKQITKWVADAFKSTENYYLNRRGLLTSFNSLIWLSTVLFWFPALINVFNRNTPTD